MKTPIASLLTILILCAHPLMVLGGEMGSLQAASLRCDDDTNPLGVDSAPPRLSWTLTSEVRGDRQTAWQILAASSPEVLASDTGDLWDSGRVTDVESLHRPYRGAVLKSSQAVFWKVRVWDQDGKPSAWSKPASWSMGLLAAGDWMAKWIGEKAVPAKPQRKAVGYHATEAKSADDVKWVQIDLGASHPVSAVLLHAMRHAGRDGFGFPVRFKVEVSDDVTLAQATLIADHTGSDFKNPGYQAIAFPSRDIKGRYVRVTATKLWKRDTMFCFALRQLEVVSGGKNVAVGAKVSHLDSVETWGWGAAALTDGLGLITAESLAESPPESPTLRLRREFTVKPGLRRALIYVCGLGQYELTANGRAASEDLFTPGWTKYDKTCLYDTRDITSLLRAGTNAIGLELAGGMYRVTGGRYTKFTGSFGPLQAIAQLRLEYADGSVATLVTDDQWRVAPGPVTFSCIFGGEDYDARRDPRGWNQPDFDDSKWAAATVHAGPGGQLRGHSVAAPPLRTFERIKPVSVKELRPGVLVYDLGQNAPIIPHLRVRGGAGAVVRLTPAELLSANGSVDRGSAGGGSAYWQYTCAGVDSESWFPKFWYHGSRFLEARLIAGTDGVLPVIEALEGVVVHSSAAAVGEFACSNDLFNRIHTLVRWAQRANIVSVITDCPHRERLGWLEQYHLNGPSLRYEWDLTRVFAKGMQDMADSQIASGLVPDIAPEYVVFSGGFRDSPEWGSAFIIVPWQQYEWTGDRELLARYYDGMKRYVAYLGSMAKGRIVSHGLGDWYDIGPKPPGPAQLTPTALTATAFYYYDAWILGQAAKLLGKADDAQTYSALAAEIAVAFNREFFKTEPPRYATDSQCANSIPLVMNLVASEHRDAVVAAIVADVAKRGNAITAGDVGYRYLLRALADGGRSDIIFAMNNQSDHPGYGYQLKKGATALTEAWDAGRGSSQNHFMLGQINEWFYHDLAGLASDLQGPGFAHVLVRPQPVGDVTWAKAGYQSPRGKITTAWKKEGRRFALEVILPPGSTATVHVPGDAARATIGSEPLVRRVRTEKGATVFTVESGSYAFTSELSP
jgi:hypothetical protein